MHVVIIIILQSDDLCLSTSFNFLSPDLLSCHLPSHLSAVRGLLVLIFVHCLFSPHIGSFEIALHPPIQHLKNSSDTPPTMENDVVAQFTEITGSASEVATQYLQITDFNIEQAMQLYFESGGAPLTNEPLTHPAATPQAPAQTLYEEQPEPVQIDSDSDIDTRSVPEAHPSTTTAADSSLEDDAAMARRLQEEAYAGADREDEDGVRAPMARTTETLVGPGPDFDDDDMHASILGQLRARQRRGPLSL